MSEWKQPATGHSSPALLCRVGTRRDNSVECHIFAHRAIMRSSGWRNWISSRERARLLAWFVSIAIIAPDSIHGFTSAGDARPPYAGCRRTGHDHAAIGRRGRPALAESLLRRVRAYATIAAHLSRGDLHAETTVCRPDLSRRRAECCHVRMALASPIAIARRAPHIRSSDVHRGGRCRAARSACSPTERSAACAGDHAAVTHDLVTSIV